MTILHRKLLPEQEYSNQTSCSYDCDYVSIHLPPEQLPQSSTTTNTTTTYISPYLIVMVSLIATAVLFTIYYFIFIKYCTRSRQVSVTEVHEQSRDFTIQDPQPEHDHPIWYITTVGLQPAVINSIRVVKFKKGHRSVTDGTDCSVCLNEFKEDEFLRVLPKCNHAFHISCIDTWLRSHTNCPLCRAAVVVTYDPNMMTRSSDMYPGFGFDRNTQMLNARNDGETRSDDIRESQDEEHRIEVHDLKPDILILRRSFSMDSNSSNLGIDLQRFNHGRDSRTRRMMMMVRSFSYGGRSIR